MKSKVVGKHSAGNGNGSLRSSATKATITNTMSSLFLLVGGSKPDKVMAERPGRPGTAKTIGEKSTEKGRMGEQKRGKPEDESCFPTLTAPCEFRWMDDDVCRMQHVNICQMIKES
jgi:hypothetical protein